ncbi:MAG: SGNH/GDSL hydrolase family protein [Planctomycetota bacterium]
MSPTRQRTLAILLSLGVSLPIAAKVILDRVHESDGDTTRLVDTRDAMHALLEAGAEPGTKTGEPLGPSAAGAIHRMGPLAPEVAEIFFPAVKPGPAKAQRFIYDPVAYMVLAPNWHANRRWAEHANGEFEIRQNARGILKDVEVLSTPPDVRILVTGDSHISGVVPNCESAANVLEGLVAEQLGARSVESLNAGVGGYNVYNYLGTLRHFKDLRPDVFIVVIYGGNDFLDTSRLHRHFAGRGPFKIGNIPAAKIKAMQQALPRLGAQELNQIAYFVNNPKDEAITAETCIALIDDMQRESAALGARLIVAYLPPPLAGQPACFKEELAETVWTLGIEPEQVASSDRIADAILSATQGRGIPTLDLRPSFRATAEPLYWYEDYHINTLGHRRVAELLAPLVVASLSED